MSQDIEAFVGLVRQYRDLLEEAHSRKPYEVLTACATLLPRIYAAGLNLPKANPDPSPSRSDVGPRPTGVSHSLGRYNKYWSVFDPVFDQAASMAFLSNDITEIYENLVGSLIDYDAGRREAAVWQWKFDLQTHCGDHLVDVLRPIHRLVHDHMPRDFQSDSAPIG